MSRDTVVHCPDGHGQVYRGERPGHAADRHEHDHGCGGLILAPGTSDQGEKQDMLFEEEAR